MITQKNHGAHSAQVEMQLLVNGFSISISQMGPDFLFVEPAIDHPPAEATIVLRVDQSERQWKVKLPQGISKHSHRVTLALVDP